MSPAYSKKEQLGYNRLPSRGKRSEFNAKQRKEGIYGEDCLICMNPDVAIHHRKFRSQSGRNNPRNGAPLCQGCHDYMHRNPEAAEELRQEAIDRFGPYYYFDKYDCFYEALIDEPETKPFEDFMEAEELKAHESVRARSHREE